MSFDYFTIEDLRALPGMEDATKYPYAKCEAAAEYIVGVIEREVGTSFVARNVVDEVHDGGKDRILLNEPYVLAVTSATADGLAVVGTLHARAGVLRLLQGGITPLVWPLGYDNVLVTYESGYSRVPPADVREKALDGTKARLLSTGADSAMNSRRTSETTETGVVNFVVAGKDQPTGFPEVDAMILGWKERLDVLGFA